MRLIPLAQGMDDSVVNFVRYCVGFPDLVLWVPLHSTISFPQLGSVFAVCKPPFEPPVCIPKDDDCAADNDCCKPYECSTVGLGKRGAHDVYFSPSPRILAEKLT